MSTAAIYGVVVERIKKRNKKVYYIAVVKSYNK